MASMDWDTTIRLLQAVSWPAVALIVSPFLIWRLGPIIRAAAEIKEAAREVRGLTKDRGLSTLMTNIPKLQTDLRAIRSELEKLQSSQSLNATTLSRLETEQIESMTPDQFRSRVEELSETAVVDDSNGMAKADTPNQEPLPATGEERYKALRREWDKLQDTLKSKVVEAKLSADARSPASLAAALMQLADRDTRQKNRLRPSDAEALSSASAVMNSLRMKHSTIDDQVYTNLTNVMRYLDWKISRARIPVVDGRAPSAEE